MWNQRDATVHLKLCSITVKKYRAQWSNTSVPEGKPDLLKQDFKADAPNQKWATDITYIHTLKDGWTYLACVLELYLHKVIGLAASGLYSGLRL